MIAHTSARYRSPVKANYICYGVDSSRISDANDLDSGDKKMLRHSLSRTHRQSLLLAAGDCHPISGLPKVNTLQIYWKEGLFKYPFSSLWAGYEPTIQERQWWHAFTPETATKENTRNRVHCSALTPRQWRVIESRAKIIGLRIVSWGKGYNQYA